MDLTNSYSNEPLLWDLPNMEQFQASDIYKEIRAASGLSRHPPEDRWNLVRALQQRESGLASPLGFSFSQSQQRCISNLYIPNKKSMRLMSLLSKVLLTKFNRRGSQVLTACQDGCVRIYDCAKGTYHLLNSLVVQGAQWMTIDADFSPNYETIAYGTCSRSLYIKPVNGVAEDVQWIDMTGLPELPNIYLPIFSLRFSPTGDKLIWTSTNSFVIVTDILTRSTQILRTHRMPGTDVNAVCFLHNKDPNVIIAGCGDGLIKVFDLRTLFRSSALSKSVASFIGHFDGVMYIDSRNDGYHVLSNSKDQSIKIWDMRRPGNMSNCREFRNQQLDLSMRLFSSNIPLPCNYPTSAKPLEGDTSIMTYRGHRLASIGLPAKFSPLEQTGQRYIYTGCATGRIIIYDALTGEIKEAIEGHRNVVSHLDWHPERAEIVSGSWDRHVHLNNFSHSNAKRSPTTVSPQAHSSDPDKRPLRRSIRLANRKMRTD